MNLPYRKSPRMPGMDYSRAGQYFITLCTYNREESLGYIDASSSMVLSSYGRNLLDSISFLADGHLGLSIDKYVIMPNHCHLLVSIRRRPDPQSEGPGNALIPVFVSTLKRICNRSCGFNLWQRSFHDHFILSHDDYLRISDYIDNNPARWADDKFHPSRFNP